MKVIGFRASPSEVVYAIINVGNKTFSVETVEKIAVPHALSFPEKLNYLRKTVKDIITEYGILRAGIRITENMAQSLNIERISFEAILQEVLSSSTVTKYFVGQIADIHSKLEIERTDFKKLVENKDTQYKHLSLADYSKNQREALLVAIATLNI